MYGLIVKLTLLPGRRQQVIDLLSAGSREMPGCFSYLIAKDIAEESVLWVTEVWDSQGSHDASLSLRAVQAMIPQLKPLIVGLEKIAITEPVAGIESGR